MVVPIILVAVYVAGWALCAWVIVADGPIMPAVAWTALWPIGLPILMTCALAQRWRSERSASEQ